MRISIPLPHIVAEKTKEESPRTRPASNIVRYCGFVTDVTILTETSKTVDELELTVSGNYINDLKLDGELSHYVTRVCSALRRYFNISTFFWGVFQINFFEFNPARPQRKWV